MIDVKKLITGFLILATAAISSGLIFSLINFAPSTAANTASADGITIGGTAAGANTGNAFVPTQAEVNELVAEVAPDLASSTMLVSSTDPTNLTDQLATEFVNGVVAANPNGPSGTDANGNPTFNAPNVNALATNIADSTTTQNLQIPNWDVEAESIPVTVIATSSPQAMVAYAVALNGIMVNHFDGAQVANIIGNQSDDASDTAYIESQTQGALQDVASLKAPAPAAAFQKSFLAELVYEKNLIQLNGLAQTDPVKASIIFQQEDQKFDSVQQNLQEQGSLIAANNLSLQSSLPKTRNTFLSFLFDTFSIPQAQAQLSFTPTVPIPEVGIPVSNQAAGLQQANSDSIEHFQQELGNYQQAAGNTAQATAASSLFGLLSSIHLQNEGEKLEALLKNTLLQILKNTLIAIIQREVLTWIQGSGAPRFITNWGTQLVNAAQTSALNAINAQMSCGVFPAFIPQVKITLDAYYRPGGNLCANQFAAALGANSFQQFYNNFANGGFVAFGASTLPSGNPYGQLFFNAQSVQLAYGNQSGVSGLQAQSSQGLNSSLVCADGSNPNGTRTECEGNDINDYVMPTGGQCGVGGTPVVEDNNGLCANGSQPQVTTPAAATGFVLQSGIDATPKQLAAANDITGVLNAVLNSLLTGLASAAVNAAGQVVNQGLTSLNGSGFTNAANTTAPAAAPLACNPSTQTLPPLSASIPLVDISASGTATSSVTASSSPAQTTLSASGGALDANGNAPIYYWTDSNGASSTGGFFSDKFATPGTYTITLSDSTGDASTTCTVIQQ